MAKTTDRQIVNGETFMIMDAEARENAAVLQNAVNTNDLMIDSTNGLPLVELAGLTLGKTLSNGGQYTDAAYGTENLRAASPVYYLAGNVLHVSVLSGYKAEIDFYDETHTFVDYVGWITGEKTIKSHGAFFRVLVGGDSTIESVYNSIATIRVQSNVGEMASDVRSLYENYGGMVDLSGWIEGKFPNWTNGQIWSDAEYKYVPRVKIIGGAKYRYSGVLNSVCGILFYDENGTYISGTNQNEFTAPGNAAYADIGTRYLTTNAELYCVGMGWSVDGEISDNDIIDFNTVAGVITPGLAVHPSIGAHADLSVTAGECYSLTGYTYVLNTYPLVIFLNGDNLVSYDNAVTSAGAVSDYTVYVPQNANRMLVNGKPNEISIVKSIKTVRDAVLSIHKQTSILFNTRKKKIVWFGMSIPAGGWFGYEHPHAYPQQVGRILNADVVNEAIGSSCIHCKDPARITTANPYGFNTNFEASSRCLTNTQAEMDWICENWNSNIWTLNKPSEMTDWLSGVIHSFGYEQKLDQYLTAETFPDLFVFDHGFNDPSDTNNYYEQYGKYSLYTFRGGMNFLIKRILDFNPYANIVIIGNYTTTRDVPQMQTEVATDWAIPICKQWETLGLSLTQETTAKGYWELQNGEYVWVTDSTERTYTMRDRLVPDHIHPWSNPTGKVTEKMAQTIAKWMIANCAIY